MKCIALGSKGPHTLVIEHSPSSAERPASGTQSSAVPYTGPPWPPSLVSCRPSCQAVLNGLPASPEPSLVHSSPAYLQQNRLLPPSLHSLHILRYGSSQPRPSTINSWQTWRKEIEAKMLLACSSTLRSSVFFWGPLQCECIWRAFGTSHSTFFKDGGSSSCCLGAAPEDRCNGGP